jgi:DNA repair protein RecO (recombination protein O)
MSTHEITDIAFVLHRYPYRETSAILDVFTQNHGRINMLVKGAQTPKSKLKTVLHPFALIEVQCRGKSALKNLQRVDSLEQCYRLEGLALMSGLYVNELLTRLLHKEEAHVGLFRCYSHTLAHLNQGNAIEPCLRYFENELLSAIGYALPFDRDADSHEALQASGYYQFVREHGFVLSEADQHNQFNVFLGAHLHAIANNEFSDAVILRAAKRLFRLALHPLLGDKPLKSREIMQAML